MQIKRAVRLSIVLRETQTQRLIPPPDSVADGPDVHSNEAAECCSCYWFISSTLTRTGDGRGRGTRPPVSMLS